MAESSVRNLRILVISNLYPSALHPDFGTFVKARVDALARQGAQVTTVTIIDPDVHARLARKYASLALRTMGTVTRMTLARTVPDVVEAHIAYPTGLVALCAATIMRRPLVLFAHGADVTEVMTRSRRHLRIGRWLMRRSSLIVANSDYLADVVRREHPSVSARVVTISPGIELAAIERHKTDPRRRAGILYVGRLVPQKGVDILLQAMALPQGRSLGVHLRIIGEGPDRSRLETLAVHEQLSVLFEGARDRGGVAQAMSEAAIVVVPSTYQEPLGLVALEGMAAGAVVVASRVGGLGPLIEDQRNGISVEPGDPEALLAGIRHAIEIIRDPARLQEVQAAARETAGAHDVGLAAQRSLGLYRALRR